MAGIGAFQDDAFQFDAFQMDPAGGDTSKKNSGVLFIYPFNEPPTDLFVTTPNPDLVA
jgi:hypothetical protein